MNNKTLRLWVGKTTIIFGLIAVFGIALPTKLQAASSGPNSSSVLRTYADIAHAMYEDSLATAETMRNAIAELLSKPSRAALLRARAAWIAARVPYQQSEGFRFGNSIVDEWEGKVNAWPLDEGMIDYVDATYGEFSDENPFFTANIVANRKVKLGGRAVDASKITPAFLSKTLHEIDEVESNVATGYHAIEFLLWGQDLNGNGPGAGNRPHTDFDTKNCTNGNCDRRAAYLVAATDLLISDLKYIIAAWKPNGEARNAVLANAKKGIGTIVKGLGSLSYGELAGERIKLGLMLHDPEEEHDCFSDNTHNSHYYNQIGMMSIYRGSYARIDGSVVKGAGLSELIGAKSPATAKRIDKSMITTRRKMETMKDLADRRVMSYDQMIGEGNTQGNKVIQDVVDSLVAQAKAIEKTLPALGLKGVEFEGSDSLDAPGKVK